MWNYLRAWVTEPQWREPACWPSCHGTCCRSSHWPHHPWRWCPRSPGWCPPCSPSPSHNGTCHQHCTVKCSDTLTDYYLTNPVRPVTILRPWIERDSSSEEEEDMSLYLFFNCSQSHPQILDWRDLKTKPVNCQHNMTLIKFSYLEVWQKLQSPWFVQQFLQTRLQHEEHFSIRLILSKPSFLSQMLQDSVEISELTFVTFRFFSNNDLK